MRAEDVYAAALDADILLYLKDGQLAYKAAPGRMSGPIRDMVTEHKPGLVLYLREKTSAVEQSGPQPLQDRTHLPVSFAQQRLWLADLAAGDGSQFNIQGCYLLTGAVDRSCFGHAIRRLTARHESLRTTFHEHRGEILQRTTGVHDASLSWIDLSHEASSTQATRVREVLADDLARRFALHREAPFRVTLVKLDEERHVAVFNLHHIAADGWSVGLLIEEFCQSYAAYHQGEDLDGGAAPLQYADYMAWHDARVQGSLLEKGLSFWDTYLEDLPVVHALPLDKVRPARRAFRGATVHSLVPPALERRLRAYCQTRKLSLFMVLETALAILLAHYGDSNDIAIGTPVAGRTHPASESLIGLMINTVVLRTRVVPGMTFDALADENGRGILGAFAHQDVPFDVLVDRKGHPRSASHAPLFQVWFVLQNNRVVDFALPGCRVEPYEDVPPPAAKYDLNLYARESHDGVHLDWVFNVDLFAESSIAYVAEQFVVLLEKIVDDPLADCFGYGIFGSAIQLPLAVSPAVDRVSHDGSALSRQLTERMVESTASTAIVHAGKAYSYGDLAVLVTGYAGAIAESETSGPIALLLGRGVDMVAAMLASLRVRRTYVPMDPGYPRARLHAMLHDAQCGLVVTQAGELGSLSGTAVAIPVILGPADSSAAPPAPSSDEPAYVLFTSGSTGRPKGVAQSHAGLAYHAASYAEAVGLQPSDRVLQLASYNFDASVLDTYGALIAGATLHLADVKALAPAMLLRTINEASITVYHSTPTVFKFLFAQAQPEDVTGLRAVVLGGEAVDAQCRALFDRLFGDSCRLFGLYGATESSFSTWLEISRHDLARGVRPALGDAIAGCSVRVVRDDGSDARIFETGQIAIRGRHVALGYWNDPTRTAERFCSCDDGTTEYFTGDMAYRLPDGAIHFVGRRDFQCKLNGVRIELEEIEIALRRRDEIAHAAVMVRAIDGEEGATQLVAYVQPIETLVGGDERALAQAWREHLAAWLPDYMIPSRFVVMHALPLTNSGKIDRLALPAPSAQAVPRSTPKNHARNSEKALADIWCEVLHIDSVSPTENFFEAGGSSMLAMQVCKRIGEHMSRDVAVVDILAYPTVRALAGYLDGDDPLIDLAGDVGKSVVTSPSHDVAIIGIACRFPGASDAEAFWQRLAAGYESIRFFSAEELAREGIDPLTSAAPNYVASRALLEGVEDFDAGHFGFTEREADITDPQHRMLLECAHEALDSAGYGDGSSSRSVGVFVGVGTNQYFLRHLLPKIHEFDSLGEEIVHANNKDHHAATRISYKLNLEGPSVCLNTACSTSLVAMHEACRSVLQGDSDMALAGGANIVEFAAGGFLHVEGDMRSADGHCRPFDRHANGTRRGNGVGLVLLKRLDAAIADGDAIHAVIKGTAVNNDGARKAGYTAPSVAGQASSMRMALDRAGVAAASIQYVEAHGTATPLGDLIELRSLCSVFGELPAGGCALGSVKANVGHLEVAAGMSSLIKVVQAMKHRQMPPQINFEAADPALGLDGSPFRIDSALRPWPPAGPRRATVSAFGLGGTNAHAVVEEAPPMVVGSSHRHAQLLTLSARSQAALVSMGDALAARLAQDDLVLADVAHTLHVGRTRHAWRRVVACETVAGAMAALRSPYAVLGGDAADVVLSFADAPLAYEGLGEDLSASEPRFRAVFEQCVAAFPSGSGRVLTPLRLFAFEYSLAQLLLSWGVTPTRLVGRGVGSIVAGCVAGVWSLDDAMELVARRAAWQADADTVSANVAWRKALAAVPRHMPRLDWIDDPLLAELHAGETSHAASMVPQVPGTPVWVVIGPAQVPSESRMLQQMVGDLWARGVTIDWTRYHADERCHRVWLPTYPFERSRHWVERLRPAVVVEASTPDTAGPLRVTEAVSAATADDDTEQWLTAVWRDLLGDAPISRDDDFFDLGGNSLLVTRLLSRIRERFPQLDQPYSISRFFEAPTIAGTVDGIRTALAIDLVRRQQDVLDKPSASVGGLL
jgi:amino acid adenylation domain-containing protein